MKAQEKSMRASGLSLGLREAYGVRGACSRSRTMGSFTKAGASSTHSIRFARFGCGSAAIAIAMHSNSLLACAACYGQSDSSLAKGMNWGIASLLVVVVGVLSGITTFFVYVAKRSASVSQPPEPKP